MKISQPCRSVKNLKSKKNHAMRFNVSNYCRHIVGYIAQRDLLNLSISAGRDAEARS